MGVGVGVSVFGCGCDSVLIANCVFMILCACVCVCERARTCVYMNAGGWMHVCMQEGLQSDYLMLYVESLFFGRSGTGLLLTGFRLAVFPAS